MQIASNDATYAGRAGYDGASHNWWQFVADGAVAQYPLYDCTNITMKHEYALPYGPQPWDTAALLNVIAVAPTA